TVNSTTLMPSSTGMETSALRSRYLDMHACGYACLDQYASAQKSESQPLLTASRSLREIASTHGRKTTGMTTMCWMTRSFILTKSAARLTGSSSVSAAWKTLSYSSLRQRVVFRPCHLFCLEATSQEVNWSMKCFGSGCVMVVVYIWMSVEKCE